MLATGRLYSFHRKTQFIPAPKGYEFDIPHNIRFSGDIVFARGRPLSGQSCIAALNMLADETEDQLCAMIRGGGYAGPRSPDRADALVYAMTELMLGPVRAEPRVRQL